MKRMIAETRALPAIETKNDALLCIIGPLLFDTVTTLLNQIDFSARKGQQIRLDLSGVDEIDSAGVALCVEWCDRARHNGAEIQFEKIPENMMRLIRVNRVSELLR